MPFHVTCVCGRLTVVPDDQGGRVLYCARCDRELQVPVIDAPLPPPIPRAVNPDDMPVIIEVESDARTTPSSAGHAARHAVRWLVAGIASVALFSALPLLISVWESQGEEATVYLERWALGILLVGLLQLAYIVYLIQVPDWSSVWVVSLVTLLIAAVYAGLMGVRLLASSGNQVMKFLELDGNRFTSGQEAGWCLIMLLLTGALSYAAGRFATRWHRADHRNQAP